MGLNVVQQARTDIVEQPLGGRLPGNMQRATALQGRKIMAKGAGLEAQALGCFIEAEMQAGGIDSGG
ncbi:hypothetical protein D3C77_224220 [compost metagenome]